MNVCLVGTTTILGGFADSLNLSVAAALVMHELFHLCPEAIGEMSEEERATLREKWFTQLAVARVQTRAEGKRAKDVQSKLARVRKKRKAGAGGGGVGVGDAAGGGDDENLAAAEAALVAEAAAIEEARWAAARTAVAPHLANPPAVLRDMRRGPHTPYIHSPLKLTQKNLSSVNYLTHDFERRRLVYRALLMSVCAVLTQPL